MPLLSLNLFLEAHSVDLKHEIIVTINDAYNIAKLSLANIMSGNHSLSTTLENMLNLISIAVNNQEACDKFAMSEIDLRLSELRGNFLAYLSSRIAIFDNADDHNCLDKKYDISAVPCDDDYACLLSTLYVFASYVIFCRMHNNNRIDVRIRQDILSIPGRFLFLFNGNLACLGNCNNEVASEAFQLSVELLLSICYSISWNIEESYIVRLLVLNSLDALNIHTKEGYSLIEEHVNRICTSLGLSKDEITESHIKEYIEKYLVVSNSSYPVVDINTMWTGAYIYKKRFGFLYCKKFMNASSRQMLPFVFSAYSPAFKMLQRRQVSNGPKVLLLESIEQKRSSEYIPKEDSFFYNCATMKFE